MTFEEFIKEYRIPLNQQQREAVLKTEGPTLLLAVPGSGKTSVIITRLGYMIMCRDIKPRKILSMTYTRAATDDMKKRFVKTFKGAYAESVEFRTINSVAYGILSEYAARSSMETPIVIQDESRIRLIRKAFNNVTKQYATESDVEEISLLITYCKNMMLDDESIASVDTEIKEFPAIFKEYNRLMPENHIDYDDQLTKAYDLLINDSEALSRAQGRYDYINVDEAQDTSKVQHLLIELLSRRTHNIFMVADDDQSLYSWRGAFPKALLDFDKTYPGASILKMEYNYRCDGNIVECADRLIQHNEIRFSKHVHADRPKKYDIAVRPFKKRDDQYDGLANIAERSSGDTAILYRYNESAIPIVDVLERKGIPYNFRKIDLSFFSHRIVSDIKAIIKFANDPTDEESFRNIYYKLSFYLKKEQMNEACRLSSIDPENKKSIWDCLEKVIGDDKRLKDTVSTKKAHFKLVEERSASDALKAIDILMGYGNRLKDEGISRRKLDILQIMAVREKTSLGFINRLEELEKVLEQKAGKDSSSGKITLSTIHSAKGLEWDTVYLIDAMNGYFPEDPKKSLCPKDSKELAGFEEERRAFYVAATRAKNHLCIFDYGTSCMFTKEFLGTEDCAKPQDKQQPAPQSSGRLKVSSSVQKKVKKPPVPDIEEPSVNQEELEAFKKKLVAGKQIKHMSYGTGTIKSLDGDFVTVVFNGREQRMDIGIVMETGLIKLLD